MRKLLLTGATGFIGSAVARELMNRSIPFVAVGGNRRPDFPESANFLFEELLASKLGNPTVCIHLAGQNNIAQVQANPEKEFDIAYQMAEVIRKLNPERIIYASSGAVYGDHSQLLHRENEIISSGGGTYAKIKMKLEAVFSTFPNAAIARFGNVYGPGMPYTTIISKIYEQIRKGKSLIEVRDFAPIRDFIFVEDVAKGLVDLAWSDASGVFNLGTGRGTSVKELIQIFKVAFDRLNVKTKETGPDGRSSSLVLDPYKTLHTIGWKARISLTEGVKKLDCVS